jgi:hypothetical protein
MGPGKAQLSQELARAVAANAQWMQSRLKQVVEAQSFSGHEQAAQAAA